MQSYREILRRITKEANREPMQRLRRLRREFMPVVKDWPRFKKRKGGRRGKP